MQNVGIVRPKEKKSKEEEAWARTWVERHFTNDELEEKKGLEPEKEGRDCKV